MSIMNAALVAHIATLANIPIAKEEETKLAQGFVTTLGVIDQLMSVDTTDIAPTHQVSGLENVWRDDVVEDSRTFTQTEALANASKTHNGYFVVPQLIAQ